MRLSVHRAARAIALVSLATAGSCWATEAAPTNAPDASAITACLALRDTNRRTEAAVREAASAVREHLRRAEELHDWFGYERFGPYVTALREQQRLLQARLGEITEVQCSAGP
jgi:hypothetical protein